MGLSSEKTTVTQIHHNCLNKARVPFDLDLGCEVLLTHTLLPLHIASIVNYHTQIAYG